MKKGKAIIPLLMFLFCGSGYLFGHTILIDSWESVSPDDMESDRRIRLVSIETGLMDSLFDDGHIFFNMYSITGTDGPEPDIHQSLSHAVDIGARYLIRLEPESDGVIWELFNTLEKSTIRSGFGFVSDMDDDLTPIEKWTALGTDVAGNVIPELR